VHLRLYKKPYREPQDDSRTRFLFEAAPFEKYSSGLPVDFYLYVWVRECRVIDSFQAVLGDELVMNYTRGKGIRVGLSGRQPFNRTVATVADIESRKRLRAVMCVLLCSHFQEMLCKVSDIACRKPDDVDHDLSAREQRECKYLLGENI